MDLLPSQADADLVCDNSSCWLLVRTLTHIRADGFDSGNSAAIFSTFNIDQVSKEHPTAIARTLLYLALCLEQLPPNFDRTLVHFPTSIKARVDRYISTVQILITSDDDLVSTVEGIECLILQGVFHINEGNPKRAWLSFRRAANVAQLMGINKIGNTMPGGLERWYQIVQADRYLVCFFFTLVLGLTNSVTLVSSPWLTIRLRG